MRSSTRFLTIAMVASILTSASTTFALPGDPLNPTGWTAFSGNYYTSSDPGPRTPIGAFNGAGLLAGADTTLGTTDDTHIMMAENTVPTESTAWMTQVTQSFSVAGNIWLMVDMQSVKTIGQIQIWNYFEGNGDRGAKNVDIWYGAPGAVLPTAGSGDVIPSPFTNHTGWTLSMSTVLAPGTANPTPLVAANTLNPVDFQARYVLLQVNSAQSGSSNVGLGEMRFLEGAAVAAEGVPEPSTFVLAALGLVGLGLLAWRRRKNADRGARNAE